MPLLRSAFIALSQNRPLRRFSESSPAGRRMSSRFVAGLEAREALAAAADLNREGLLVTLDALGENVSTPDEARRSAAAYHGLIEAIGQGGLRANVSVKLTQMGMDLGRDLAEGIVGGMVEHAASVGTFVRVDMEGTQYTQETLDLVCRLHRRFPGSVGVVIQAYLRRSEQDVRNLVREGIRIRLCKGAYKEPPTLAFPDKREVDRNFLRLTRMLLESGLYHGIATHDPRMIAGAARLARELDAAPEAWEFQMLYGIRRDLQRALVRAGYNMRVYVPFGQEWYPYFMRRLAERPANVLFLAKNFFKN